MKHVMSALVIMAILLMVTATGFLIALINPISKTIIISPNERNTPAQVEPSEPIVITSNFDFVLFGAAGVGTRSDPYRFENLQIIQNGSCFVIQDTTSFFVISNCSLQSSFEYPAILFQNVENGRVEECRIKGGSSGLELRQSIDCSIENSIVYDCWNGIALYSSSNNTILESKVHDNHKGIFFEQTNHCLIINNSIYANFQHGIQIPFNSHNNTIYGNNIGWNDNSGAIIENAFDSGDNNTFDDGASIGNFWSDYNETETYTIPGPASSIDQFAQLLEDDVNPGVIPLIDVAVDVEASGNILIWSVYDQFPSSYIISEDNEELVTEVWESRVISYGLDHLDVGTYSISLSLFDAVGNEGSDRVIVTVVSFILGGIGTELVMIASGVTVASFVIVVYLIKRLS